MFLHLLLLLPATLAAWSYNHIAQWPSSCLAERQSPINISISAVEKLRMPPLQFNDKHRRMKAFVKTTDQLIEIVFDAEEAATRIPPLQGGLLQGRYKLHSMRFRWSKAGKANGSEHAIDSRRSDMELQIVHYKATSMSYQHAAASDDKDALAIISILLEEEASLSADPGLITQVFSSYDLYGADDEGFTMWIDNPYSIVPDSCHDRFFTYEGSLTTPPCQQVVRWFVCQQVVSMRYAPLRRLRLTNIPRDSSSNGNNRAVQPLHDRKIYRPDVADSDEGEMLAEWPVEEEKLVVESSSTNKIQQNSRIKCRSFSSILSTKTILIIQIFIHSA